MNKSVTGFVPDGRAWRAKMKFGVAVACFVGGVLTLSAPSHAAGSVRSAVEVQMPMLDVDLYDAPGRNRKTVKSIPGSEFPAEVEYISTDISAGRMHHIRLENQPGDFWVDGTEVWISAYDGVIEVFCDADQTRAMGNTGRGAGGRSTCRKK